MPGLVPLKTIYTDGWFIGVDPISSMNMKLEEINS